jgi:choline dehydrogenase-like flavoprotein
VATDGTIVPGVHVADAAAFPSMPALSPTFTIMANAHRTVTDSLGGRKGVDP